MGVNHLWKDARGCDIATTFPLSKTDAYASTRLYDFMPLLAASDLNATRFFCTTACVIENSYGVCAWG